MEEYFDINKSIGFMLSKASSSMRMSFNKRIKENGIDATAEQWGLLNIIYVFPGITQIEIAQKSLKDKTNVTRMLDLLEKKECIERRRDKVDRRVFKIFLTNKGRLLLNSMVPVAVKTNQNATKEFTKKEINTLVVLLNKLYTNTKGEENV
jgi:MarR family transcriptional regulator, organic hydroperoxide resistance regulator